MTTTQSAYPWRTVLRTTFQTLIGLAVLVPIVASEMGWAPAGGIAAVVLGVCATITRIMAIPAVNDFLRAHLSWLAPDDQPAKPVHDPNASLQD